MELLCIGIIDLVLVLALFGPFYYLPVKRIKDTATVMMAYGRNGEEWQRKMLKKYWQIPVAVVAVFVVSFTLVMMSKDHKFDDLINFMAMSTLLFLLFWPVITCYRANKAYYELEEWYQANLERRIAAGYGSPGDVYGYIQGVKKREFDKGFAAGELSERR